MLWLLAVAPCLFLYWYVKEPHFTERALLPVHMSREPHLYKRSIVRKEIFAAGANCEYIESTCAKQRCPVSHVRRKEGSQAVVLHASGCHGRSKLQTTAAPCAIGWRMPNDVIASSAEGDAANQSKTAVAAEGGLGRR